MIANAIDVATKGALVAVAIAPREGQVPMVGSYLSQRGVSATCLLTVSSIYKRKEALLMNPLTTDQP